MRKAYIDNIRWAAVWLVLIYHVCYMFNGVGILGGIPGAENIPAFDTAAAMVYPWFMVLLFLLAGMSARYSLCKGAGGEAAGTVNIGTVRNTLGDRISEHKNGRGT